MRNGLIAGITATLAFFAEAIDEPLPASRVTFTGDTRPEQNDNWKIDTSPKRYWFSTIGDTYYYKCGEYSDRDFDPYACAALSKWTGCSDNRDNPFAGGGKAETCAARSSTGVTVFLSGKELWIPDTRLWSDACGWLGGRCGRYYKKALAFTYPDDKWRKDGAQLYVDIDVEGTGAVWLYNT